MKTLKYFFMVMLLAFASQAFFTGCQGEVSQDAPVYYTVTFYKNYEGASPESSFSSYEEGKTAYFYSVSRTGYKFLGWAKKADATVADYKVGDSIKVVSNMSFYAVWQKIDSFTITFDAGFVKDGESSAQTKSQTVKVSSESSSVKLDANTFTRAGFVFMGWSKTKTSSYSSYASYYADGQSVEYFYEDTTLYAVWLEEAKTIKVTYNKNDGTATPQEMSYYVEKGKSFTLHANSFTRENYTFAGWSKSKNSKYKSYADEAYLWASDAESDITLYALWHDEANYVITYYSNFDGSTYSYIEQTLEKSESGTKATLLENTFERPGYVFYGWYTSSILPKSSGTVSNFYTDGANLTLYGDENLYACWLEDKSTESVKLIYNKNDGSESPEEVSQYVKYGSKPSYTYSWSDTNYNKLRANTFTRENYEFSGWATSSSATSATYTDAETNVYFTSNTTLYAVWKYKGPVTITFDANGGKDSNGNTTATQTITANTYTELNVNAFTKENFSFAGWSTYADATYVTYSDKQSVKFAEPSVTLYAVWKANPLVTFNGNGGLTGDGKETTAQSIPYGVSTALSENPFTKENSTFIGWSKYQSGTSATYTDKESITVYSDTTLYAVWKDDIVLTFNANGGNGTNFTQNVKYDTKTSSYKFTVPENPFTKSGYAFIGWGIYASSNPAYYKAGENATVYSSQTLYAVWAKESVPVTFEPNTDNGGSGTSFTQNLLLNAGTLKYEATLPANTFTNSNGVFVGWSTDKKPSSNYQIEQIMGAGEDVSLSLSDLPNTEGFTVYAVWKTKTYTVTYDLGGNGENIVKTVTNTAEYGKSMTYNLEEAPASGLDYYSFAGWSFFSQSSSASYAAGQKIQLDDDETFYAVWKLDGAIVEKTSWNNIASSSKTYYEFTLLKTESLSVTASADGDLYFYMMTEEDGVKWWNGNAFSYKTAVSGEKVTSVSGSVNLGAGKYRYGIQNKNIFSSKNYKLTIKPLQ